MPGPVSMRTLYFRRGLVRRRAEACAVLHVTPLFRELILEAVRLGKLRRDVPLHGALRALLTAQLQRASGAPMFVTMPSDPRVRVVASAVIDNPAERCSLAAMCGAAGASARTMQRIFRREVGSNFRIWRRQVRLVKAVELLVSGQSVKEASFALGYQQPTAFVEMFRSVLGTTPGAWIQTLRSKELNG